MVMADRIRKLDDWEALQDEIANYRTSNKRGQGQVYPSKKLKRRTEARKAHLIRKERQGKGRW